MQKLIDGIHKFQQEVFSREQKLFENLADGQSPLALFITCSDSRIDPNRLTQTTPGELFILRTAGNIIPPYGTVFGGEAATIEYAVRVLKVRDIIVCGHSHCGAVSALLDPKSTEDLPAVRGLLQHAEATRRIVVENYAHITEPDKKLTLGVEENVLVQIENLRTHPAVAAALGRRELSLHAWVYAFERGIVFSFNPKEGQFLPINEASPPVHESNRALPVI
jgi:carbonic anhydrase